MYTSREIRKKIKLTSLTEVHEFVKLADACDFDVNIGYDRILIDGKSIVGVMGLDLGRALTVNYNGDSPAMEHFLDTHPWPKN